MAEDPTAFSVWHRNLGSAAVDFQYQAGQFYDVVEKCIKLCQSMLRHPDTQRAFVALGEEVKRLRPGALVNSKDMEKKTKDFFGSIFTHFPTVIVDYTLREADYMGFHERQPMNTAYNPRLQWISVNGERVGHMVAAWHKAKTEATADNKLQYHRFLFLYSGTMLHELAHVYITYLGLGRFHTPEEINEGQLKGMVSGTVAEAGCWLEKKLFGGTVNEYRDPDPNMKTEDDMSGVPFLCTSDGPHRIDQKTIDNIVSGDIEFPYRYSGPREMQDLLNMASNYSGPETDAEMDFDLLEDKISEQSVRPPPNINIDDLWHPARRS